MRNGNHQMTNHQTGRYKSGKEEKEKTGGKARKRGGGPNHQPWGDQV